MWRAADADVVAATAASAASHAENINYAHNVFISHIFVSFVFSIWNVQRCIIPERNYHFRTTCVLFARKLKKQPNKQRNNIIDFRE